MSNQAVDVEVLGKLTRVNCPPGQEQALKAAADELNQRLNEMTAKTKVNNEVQLLIIAALNMSYELHERNSSKQQQEAQTEEKIKALTKLLEDSLVNTTQGMRNS